MPAVEAWKDTTPRPILLALIKIVVFIFLLPSFFDAISIFHADITPMPGYACCHAERAARQSRVLYATVYADAVMSMLA